MAIIKQLRMRDKSKPEKAYTNLYPVTLSEVVFMKDRKTTVDDAIADMKDDNSTIEFRNSKVIKTVQSGNVITTEFKGNTIVETCQVSADDNTVVYIKTTTFDGDTITTETEWKER